MWLHVNVVAVYGECVCGGCLHNLSLSSQEQRSREQALKLRAIKQLSNIISHFHFGHLLVVLKNWQSSVVRSRQDWLLGQMARQVNQLEARTLGFVEQQHERAMKQLMRYWTKSAAAALGFGIGNWRQACMWWREDQLEQNFQERFEQQRLEQASVEAELGLALRFEQDLEDSHVASSTLKSELQDANARAAEATQTVQAERQVSHVLREELELLQGTMRAASAEDDQLVAVQEELEQERKVSNASAECWVCWVLGAVCWVLSAECCAVC